MQTDKNDMKVEKSVSMHLHAFEWPCKYQIVTNTKSLSVIVISERLLPFCGGFNDTFGMSFDEVKTDLYCCFSMLAIFFGSSWYRDCISLFRSTIFT